MGSLLSVLCQTSSLKEGNCLRLSEMVLHARMTISTRGLTWAESCWVCASCSCMEEALQSCGKATECSPTDTNRRGFADLTCVSASTSQPGPCGRPPREAGMLQGKLLRSGMFVCESQLSQCVLDLERVSDGLWSLKTLDYIFMQK